MHQAQTYIRHWLVPHRGNQHHPHLIRRQGLVLMAALIVVVQLGYNLALSGHPRVLGYATDITVQELYAQTNQQRAANGLPQLQLNPKLAQAADLKAQDMLTYDYWAHVSPNGVPPWYWFEKAGYGYKYAGENLAKNFTTTSGVLAGWMASSEHRANILDTRYQDVGFAVVDGWLQGSLTTLVVALYGSTTASAANVHLASQPAGKVSAATQAPGPVRLGTIAQSLNPAALLIVSLLLLGFLVSLATYLVSLRRRPKRRRKQATGWYRHHSLYKAAGFAVLFVVVIVASRGVVG